jgi:hypothetical protein
MACRTVAGRGWRVPSWRVLGVVAGTDVAADDGAADGLTIRSGGDEEHVLWGGLRLDLFRDAAASYWANLTGSHPSLFVLCVEQEDGRLVPKSVTADHDEAGSGVEVNDRVYSAPIPPEIYQHLEAFVVMHHAPEEKRRRKRADWTADEPREH